MEIKCFARYQSIWHLEITHSQCLHHSMWIVEHMNKKQQTITPNETPEPRLSSSSLRALIRDGLCLGNLSNLWFASCKEWVLWLYLRLQSIKKITYPRLFSHYYLSQRSIHYYLSQRSIGAKKGGRRVLSSNIYWPFNIEQSLIYVSYVLMSSFNTTSEMCVYTHTQACTRAHTHICTQHPPGFQNSLSSKRNYENTCGTWICLGSSG